jgi:hypothetical protein
MSYEAEVLADSPALYLRLAEVGTDSNGAAWPDISGNGLDGEQVYTSTTSDVARGFPSAVETDGGAREFRSWAGGAPLAAGTTGTSRLFVPDDALLHPTIDFAAEQVFRPLSDIPLAGTFGISGKVSTGGIVLTWSGGTRIGGYCVDTGNNLWIVKDTSFLATDFLGEPFHVVVVRIVNSLCLYINGTLRAITTITSGLPTKVTSGVAYVQDPAIVALQARHGEFAWYTHALTADRILAHYEAMFNNNPLFGRADMHMIATLDGDLEPTPQLFPFSHNWESEVRETLAWSTDVIPAETDYEQRAGIRQRPTRTLEFDAFIPDSRLRRRFHAYLFQNQRRTIYLADETEAAALTADAPSGSTDLDFVSAGRGFEDGGLLAIYQDEDNFEIVEIDTVGETSTTLDGITANDWTKGNTRAVPVVRAYIADQLDFSRHTDQLEETTIEFRVLAQDVPLNPRRNGTYTPRYTYKGIEVFDPFILGTNNWNETGRGQVTIKTVDPESPAGIFSRSPFDSASREIVSYSLFLDSRAAISKFLAWAWSIQGRRVPVWVPTLQKDFDLVSTAGSSPATITVEGHDFTNFYQSHPARRDLALIYANETMVFRRIAGAETSGANDALELEGVGAVTLTNLQAVSFLKLSRLQEDTIGLVWHTDELVEVTLNFLELLTTPD